MTSVDHRASAIVAGALVSLAVVVPARAQVNAESLRPRIVNPGFSGSFDLSLGLAKGNVDYVDVGTQARLQLESLRPLEPGQTLRYTDQRVYLVGSARYAERTAIDQDRAVPFVNQTFLHARWTSMWRPVFGTEIFAQVQTNDFLRLRARTLGGAGVRFEIVHEADLQIWAGTGTMLEWNRIEVAAGATDPPTELLHRSTSYLGIRTEISDKKVLLQATGYMQPAWKSPGDFRALFELEALVKLGDRVSLGQNLAVLHDSRPPTTVRPTDLRLTTTAKISF